MSLELLKIHAFIWVITTIQTYIKWQQHPEQPLTLNISADKIDFEVDVDGEYVPAFDRDFKDPAELYEAISPYIPQSSAPLKGP